MVDMTLDSSSDTSNVFFTQISLSFAEKFIKPNYLKSIESVMDL